MAQDPALWTSVKWHAWIWRHRGAFPFLPLWHQGAVGFLFGLWPRSAVVLLFSPLRRNANLAGGFAGRPCLSCFLVWFNYCHCHALLYSLDVVFVLSRVFYVYPALRTEPVSFIGRTWKKIIVKFFCTVWCAEDWWTTVYMLLERRVHSALRPHYPTLRVWFRVFGICSLCAAFGVSVIDVDLECGVLVGLTPIPDSTRIRCSLRLELKIHTLVGHWDLLACLWHRAVWTLQVMRTYSWKLLVKSSC